MTFEIWYFLCWLVTVFTLDLRLYYFWARIGRRLLEKEYIGKAIKQYRSSFELQNQMRLWIWREDPYYQLYDMISLPAAFEARALNGNQGDDGDCDEFSLYAVTALEQIQRDNGNIDDKLCDQFSLVTVPWVHLKTWKPSGHNIGVFRYLVPGKGYVWAWVSNWYQCRIQWVRPDGSYFESPKDIVEYMCKSQGVRSLRWLRISLDLKTVNEHGSEVG